MDESTGASTEALHKGASRFEQIRDELQGKLTALRGIVDVVRADWQGSAGNSFQIVTKAWEDRQKDLIETLTNTATAIRSNGTVLGGANQAAKEAIDKIPLPQLGPSGGRP